jgi:hypothetical protein
MTLHAFAGLAPQDFRFPDIEERCAAVVDLICRQGEEQRLRAEKMAKGNPLR